MNEPGLGKQLEKEQGFKGSSLENVSAPSAYRKCSRRGRNLDSLEREAREALADNRRGLGIGDE